MINSLCCRQISRIRSCDVMFDLSSSMKPKCLKERNEDLTCVFVPYLNLEGKQENLP